MLFIVVERSWCLVWPPHIVVRPVHFHVGQFCRHPLCLPRCVIVQGGISVLSVSHAVCGQLVVVQVVGDERHGLHNSDSFDCWGAPFSIAELSSGLNHCDIGPAICNMANFLQSVHTFDIPENLAHCCCLLFVGPRVQNVFSLWQDIAIVVASRTRAVTSVR